MMISINVCTAEKVTMHRFFHVKKSHILTKLQAAAQNYPRYLEHPYTYRYYPGIRRAMMEFPISTPVRAYILLITSERTSVSFSLNCLPRRKRHDWMSIGFVGTLRSLFLFYALARGSVPSKCCGIMKRRHISENSHLLTTEAIT